MPIGGNLRFKISIMLYSNSLTYAQCTQAGEIKGTVSQDARHFFYHKTPPGPKKTGKTVSRNFVFTKIFAKIREKKHVSA